MALKAESLNILPPQWVICWDGIPIGLEVERGGYPFRTWNLSYVKFWETEVEATEYFNFMIENVLTQPFTLTLHPARLNFD